MDEALTRLVRAGHGVVTRRDALRAVPAHVWLYAVCTGQLVPGWRSSRTGPEIGRPRRRAALAHAGSGAALSHTSALAIWGLPAAEPDGAVHITTGLDRRLRVPGIVAHRRAGFVVAPPQVVVRAGLPVLRLEQSLVDAWPLATADAQRAPLLYAVGERMTTPERVADVVAAAPHLLGRETLRALLQKITAGCRSELELWGYDNVFTGPGMPEFQWQVRVALGSRAVVLDVYDPETHTNFELDGAKYHASPRDRERDLRRDAALATIGIVVVRLSHDRLVHEPDRVRHEVLAILAMRRRQLVPATS